MADKKYDVQLNLNVQTNGLSEAGAGLEKVAESAKKVEKAAPKAKGGVMAMAAGFTTAAMAMKVAKMAFSAFTDGLKQTKEGEKALKTIKSSFDNIKVSLAEGAMPAVNMFVDFLTSNQDVIEAVARGIGKTFSVMAQVLSLSFNTIKLTFQTMTLGLIQAAELVSWGQTRKNLKASGDAMAADMVKTTQAIKNTWEDMFKGIDKLTIKPKEVKKSETKKPAVSIDYGQLEESMKAEEELYSEQWEVLKLKQIENSEWRLSYMKDSIEKELELEDLRYTKEAINLDAQKMTTGQYFEQYEQLTAEHYERLAAIEAEFGAQDKELREASLQEDIRLFQEKMAVLNEYLNQVAAIASQVQSFIISITTMEVNAIKAAADEKKKEAKDTIKNKKKLDAELTKIDEEAKKQEKDARKNEAAAAIIMAIINTAVGVTKALASTSPPASYILAALTAAAGAAQVALIASQSFATGGVVEGSSTTGDRTMVGINAGEMVLNRGQQQRLLALADGTGTTNKGNITIGGDTIVIQGSVTDESLKAIRMTREDQLRDIRMLLTELNYAGQMV